MPTLALMVLAVLVTRVFEHVTPESIAGLAILGLLATVAMWLLSAVGFALLYLWQGSDVLSAVGAQPGTGLYHFLNLGLKAALIWAPLVLITVMTAPRRWKTATW